MKPLNSYDAAEQAWPVVGLAGTGREMRCRCPRCRSNSANALEELEALELADELRRPRRPPVVGASRAAAPRPRSPDRAKPRPPTSPQQRPAPPRPRVRPAQPASTRPRHGMEYVRWVQSALNQIRGLRLPIDGVMAPETRSALRAFQQDKGLPADGIAGPETKEALRAARAAPDDSAGGTAPDVVASPEPIPEPTAESKAEPQELETLELEDTLWESEVDRGSRTYMIWVQHSLNRIDAAGLAVDGIKGPLTSAAIRAFQTRQRLTADAIVGPLTEAALVKSGASQPPGSSPPVGGTPAPGTRPSTPSRSPTSGTPSVTVASNARVTASAVRALESILHGAGLSSAFITSGQRDSADQARVMYNNLVSFGVSEQKRLYGSYGDQVIDVYVAEKAKGRSASAIQAAMRARIVALGCYNVSHHCSESQDVIDVSPGSISDHAAFLRALTAALASGLVTKFLTPNDSDPAFHIELADASSAGELMDEILLAPPLPPRAFVPDHIARRLHTLRQRAG